MAPRERFGLRGLHPLLVALSVCVPAIGGCGGGSSVAPKGGGDDGTPVDLGGGITVRVINVGDLRVVTEIYQGRVYTALDGTEMMGLSAVHKAEGNLIAFDFSEGGSQLATFSVFFPPAAGGPTSLLGDYYAPAWSPDGSQLCVGEEGSGDLLRVNYDGTAASSLGFTGQSPAWSSDGRFVVYQRHDGNDYEIYRRPAAGGSEEQLTDNAVDDKEPTISPSGTEIAFQADDGSDFEIYTQDATGLNSGRTKITSNSVSDENPDWSPDGRRIVFDSSREGDWEIYTMDTDGSDAMQLTEHIDDDASPAWSPDGSKIVWWCREDEVYGELYTMNADGSNQVRLTNNTLWEYEPDWSPAVLSHPRVYVGAGGQDRGSNPPFGSGIDGAILIDNQTPRRPPDTNCVAFDVPRYETVTITMLDEPGVVYEVTGTANFMGMWEDRQAGTPPLVYIGPAPAPIAEDAVSNLVIVFDPFTGRITRVLPVSASAAAERALSIGPLRLERRFLGQVIRQGDELVWEEFGSR